MQEDGGIDQKKRRFLIGATSVVGGIGVAAAAVPFAMSFWPSERAKAAGAPVEQDIGKLEPGQQIKVEWRGKVVWIINRTPAMLATLPKLDDRVAEAAASGGAAALAERLPDGFSTRLGRPFGGEELSGGEWQRVALSRAFMRDADVLILDEPTAALDVRTEHEIYRRFAKLTRGKTTLLVSHRFSTVRMADRIVVLSGGHLIEEGSHQELMARGGLYASMFEMQAASYR